MVEMSLPKFRAWDKESQTMIDVLFVDYSHQLVIGEHYEFGVTVPTSHDDVIFMMSTGLFDKNEQEIFKGDVIRKKGTANETVGHGYQDLVTSTGEFVVCFEGGAFVAKGTYKKHYQSIDQEKIERVECLLSQLGDGYEVVGNIYENPEMVGSDV